MHCCVQSDSVSCGVCTLVARAEPIIQTDYSIPDFHIIPHDLTYSLDIIKLTIKPSSCSFYHVLHHHPTHVGISTRRQSLWSAARKSIHHTTARITLNGGGSTNLPSKHRRAHSNSTCLQSPPASVRRAAPTCPYRSP